jgi:outer membrane protein assembly factor BamA
MRVGAAQRLGALLSCIVFVLLATTAAAQPDPGRPSDPTPQGAQTPEEPPPAPKSQTDPEASGAIPTLEPPSTGSSLYGRTITRIEIVPVDARWNDPVTLRLVKPGDVLTGEIARRALSELTDSGRYANVSAEVEPAGSGVLLRLRVTPRRIAAGIRIVGGVFDTDETLRIAELYDGAELTSAGLRRVERRVQAHYVWRGFPTANTSVDVTDTDDPMTVILTIDIRSGEPLLIARRKFKVWPSPDAPGLKRVLSGYAVEVGDRADQEDLVAADRELETDLKSRGWHRATVGHALETKAGRTWVVVDVKAGPFLRLKFEGAQTFDVTQLERAVELATAEDRTPRALSEKVREFYVARGFLDAEVSATERGGPNAPVHDLVFKVRERKQVQITKREYPCLTGERTASDVGSEIDSFLSEELPGSGFLSSVDPRVVDQTFGPGGTTGARPVPFEPNPWKTYVPEVYERALKHVQDLYRSEGYLSATVGPLQLVRRHCDPRSPPGECRPIGPRRRPRTQCLYDEIGLPLEEPPPASSYLCVADPLSGATCEPEAVLHLPIKLGPRSFLYDLAFEGNRLFTEEALEEIAELELGAPASQVELEKARRRVLDGYAEEGFAFAEADAILDLSPDHTRARARFSISEREQVKVSGIVVRGAKRTNEGLIRSRVALKVGEPYRRSDIRKTEERLATLGVFSTITVGLEDPYVPAKEKVVVITLQERKPQYLDVRPGFSTGEGFRITFEYGHRNLVGEAIQLTARIQLGYLPNALILERDVREKYDDLTISERLERRNSLLIEFPEVGLGPLFRLSLEGLDVRDNARDFGLTKDAGIVTLTYRPIRQFSAFIGTSLERNDAEIFGSEQKEALKDYVEANPRSAGTFKVPEGVTVALAERIGFAWDRRDNPLGATRGTLVSTSVEHVRAPPVGSGPAATAEDATDPFAAPPVSQFLRFTQRLAGYVRLNEKGLAIAASMRWGFNQQLRDDSQTYPDRLFFMGGVDSIRGFLQDSLIPEDIAQQLLDESSGLGLNQVVIRGGDSFINPRLELRIPLSGNVQTGLFLDTGNLWRDPQEVDPLRLRYAIGSGLRIGTPIGPLVFDYGFNVERVLDQLYPERANQRFWEDIGAFHFSIGLF